MTIVNFPALPLKITTNNGPDLFICSNKYGWEVNYLSSEGCGPFRLIQCFDERDEAVAFARKIAEVAA